MKVLKVFVLLVFITLFLTNWQNESEKRKIDSGINEKMNLKENTKHIKD